MSEPKYVGVPVFFSGRTVYVPSLSIRQFQQHFDLLSNPLIGDDEESVNKRFNTYVPLIGLALRRNYPDISDDQLFDELDLNTFSVMLRAVQTSAGMKAVKPGEAEATPAT